LAGAFGKQLFELRRSEFLIAARQVEQRKEQAEVGVHFLLVTYSLGKQRKVTRRKGEKKSPLHAQT
jgi:hypothetical protein